MSCAPFSGLVVWITQIKYSQCEIEDQIAKFEDDAEYYLMGINGILKHQIYSAEYFGTTLLFSGFVAKGVAQFQRNMHPISITIITGRTNVGSILCR